METEASFTPTPMGEDYDDISSEPAREIIDSITPEVVLLLCIIAPS